MGRKKVRAEKKLKHVIATRINEETYRTLADILPNTGRLGMSDLIRAVLDNRRVKVFTRDPTFDPVKQEFEGIRKRLNSAGEIINSHARSFNSSNSLVSRQLFAKLAFAKYASLEPEIDRLIELAQLVAAKFLNEKTT
jgi:hypothetical protein